jgi:hypothetical protein
MSLQTARPTTKQKASILIESGTPIYLQYIGLTKVAVAE